MERRPYPIRLGDEQRADISAVADAVNMKFADTIRKAIEFGLPIVRKRLTDSRTRETQRAGSKP